MKLTTAYIYSLRSVRLFKTILAGLVIAVVCFAALPARAGNAEAAAQKAFDNWKAAMQKVEQKEAAVKAAEDERATALSHMKDEKNLTDSEKATLQALDNKVAQAKAELKAAEDELMAAFNALEDALRELPDSSELKKELRRQREIIIGHKQTTLSPQTQQIVQASTKTGGGLQVTTFNTANGQVIVNLPDDIAAGDMISGTVIAEPQGNSEADRARNRAELNGYVIELRPAPGKSGGDNIQPIQVRLLLDATKQASVPFRISLPDTREHQDLQVNLPPNNSVGGESRAVIAPGSNDLRNGPTVRVSLVNSDGKQIAQTTIPTGIISGTPDAYFPTSFNIPPLGQTGRPLVITGPFDGDSSNTTLTASALRSRVQDFEKNTENVSGGFGLLAESRHKAVFLSPENVTGPIEITLKEGNTQTTGSYRNVGVNLTAPKTSLLKGESTELHIQVNGLDGLKEPVPLTLESHGVITMQGGTYQPLTIQPSQVGADGSYSTTRAITGLQAGAWGATATVVTGRFNACFESDNPVAPRLVRLNTFTGDYMFSAPGGSAASQTGGGPTTGKGTVVMKGCVFTLTHNAADRRVRATIDQCKKSGSASLDTLPSGLKFTITDQPIGGGSYCAIDSFIYFDEQTLVGRP